MATPRDPETVFLLPSHRNAAVNALGEHYANGRLTADQCRERVTAAYAAHTNHDLAVLFEDLPGPAPLVPVPALGESDGPAAQEITAPYGVEAATGLPYSDKSKKIGAVLQLVLPFGIGRFYTGHYAMATIQLIVAFAGFGVLWCWVDAFVLLLGRPLDTSGLPLR